MRRKVLSIFLSIVLVMTFLTTVSIVTFAEETVIANGESEINFEKEKILFTEDFLEGANALSRIVRDNSEMYPELHGRDGYIANCIVVSTEKDIEFDTAHILQGVRFDGIYYLQYDSAEMAENAIKEFRADGQVEYVCKDDIVYLNSGETGTSQDLEGYQHYSWGVTAMNADTYAGHLSHTTSGSVTVAVVDSGIEANLPFFQGRVLSGGYDFVNNDSTTEDDDSFHGTYVAGIIVDCSRGLDINILPLKVFEGESTTGTMVGTAIRFAVNNGADVINLSLDGSVYDADHSYQHTAIDYALAHDVAVVAASGNHYKSTSRYCPAHRDDIIVAAAVDSLNNNYHTPDGKGSNYGTSVDVTAPGVDVRVASSACVYATGTSYAAPHVSAAVAMLKLAYPNATPAQLETMIKNCATDLGPSGYDTTYGYGLPNLSNLIPSMPFDDVSSNDWFFYNVFNVYTRGYMTGRSEGHFGATENIERQDAAVLLYRMAGSPAVTFHNVFLDVQQTDYFANAAVWAYDNVIITGQSGNLGVCNNMTRQDFITVLYRLANYMNLNTNASASLTGYSDYTLVSPWAQTPMQWAVAKGIVGQNVTSLNPQNNVVRAEIAAMVSRFLQAYNL